jgi:hypothetical protein
MVSFTKEELVSSTEVSRNFANILNDLKKKRIQKAAILRNNRMEAVLMPIEDYEKLVNDADLAEQIEIYNLISQRESTFTEKFITFENVLKEYGLNEDEL